MRSDGTQTRFNHNNVATEGRRSFSTTHHDTGGENRRFPTRNSTTHHQASELTNVFYGINGGERDEYDFDLSTRSVSSRMTQEWLEDAKLLVANNSSSPSRGTNNGSPVRLIGSPRFASQGRLSVSSLERRDPLSRSARRQRGGPEGIGREILSRTDMHQQTIKSSDPFITDPSKPNQSSVMDNLNNKIFEKGNFDPPVSPKRHNRPPSPNSLVGSTRFPPRQSIHRRTRFQTGPNPNLNLPMISNNITAILTNENNLFKNLPSPNNNSTILEGEVPPSPPMNLIESAHRRSISSGTCSVKGNVPLSSPRNLIESAQRKSISSNTCSKDGFVREEKSINDEVMVIESCGVNGTEDLNYFLREQRLKIEKLLSGEINGKAKIVLSGPSNSTSSMVAAICYAWLLENQERAAKKKGELERGKKNNYVEFVVSVMNLRRAKMWRQKQVAWLFHHFGLDALSLLFANEVDLETLMMSKQLSLLVVGEDILKTNGEVLSSCTVLTDNYCEVSYELLQTPIVKKLLLAGILLDTANLSNSTKESMTRDAEAVQLLSLSFAPNYTNTIFDQLMQDQRDEDFIEAMRRTYGEAPGNSSAKDLGRSNGSTDIRTKKLSPVAGKPIDMSPTAAQQKPVEASRGKNRNFFAKLFGFGSKW